MDIPFKISWSKIERGLWWRVLRKVPTNAKWWCGKYVLLIVNRLQSLKSIRINPIEHWETQFFENNSRHSLSHQYKWIFSFFLLIWFDDEIVCRLMCLLLFLNFQNMFKFLPITRNYTNNNKILDLLYEQTNKKTMFYSCQCVTLAW